MVIGDGILGQALPLQQPLLEPSLINEIFLLVLKALNIVEMA